MKFLKSSISKVRNSRAQTISLISAVFATVYHLSVMFVFYFLHLKPLFYYNIFSTLLFTTIMFFVPRLKSFVAVYVISAIEVIVHQVLANYFLGTLASFHFFILLFALLPFLIFEDKRYLSTPFSVANAVIFITLQIVIFPGVWKPSYIDNIVIIFRGVNVLLSTIVIMFITFVYTYLTARSERLLNSTNEKLNSEILLAAKIQQNFLPQKRFENNEWELDFYNKPMAGVSGDVYDIFAENGIIDGFNISDVSGHGISSGMITMLVRNTIRKEFYRDKVCNLENTAERINTKIINEKGDIHNYFTGILVRLRDTNLLEFLNAGHPYPIYFNKAENSCKVIERDEKSFGPIGLKDLPVSFKAQSITMQSGDEFILYTDGISEALNDDNKQFGVNRICEIIKSYHEADINTQITQIISEIKAFSNNREQDDDMTIMILKKK